MCFKTKTPPLPQQQPAPATDENSSLMKEARKKANQAQGVFANIFTSALGDPGFDKSTSRQTATPATLTV
jgi:hypothetical protein